MVKNILVKKNLDQTEFQKKQAGAELCQAQISQQLQLKLQSKLAVEVVIKVGVQLLLQLDGGGWVGVDWIKLNEY